MKQLLRKGLKDLVVDEVPDPLVKPHHVLVSPIFSLISSGTESASIHQEGVLKAVAENPSHLAKIWNVLKVQGPLSTFSEVKAKFSEYAVLGYSGAGAIVEKHHTVTDLEVGDLVAYGGEGTGHAEIILAGRNLVVKVPDSLPLEHACFATLGSIALNGVRIANISLGEKVAVIGLGLVGQLIAQLARLQGGNVIAIDLNPHRVELAQQLGADLALLSAPEIREHISAVTDGVGVDCVIIAAASKSSVPCEIAVEICRDRGRIVDVGAVELNFPWNEMYLKEIQFFMARAYGPGSYDPMYEGAGHDYPLPYVRWTENRNMQEFLRLVSLDNVQIRPLITHQFDLEEAPEAYKTILDPAANSVGVLLRYPNSVPKDSLPSFRPTRKVDVVSREENHEDMGVALVGAGNLAKWVHLPNLKKTKGAVLRAVHSSSGARGKNYAKRFEAEYCTTDYDEILRDPRVQVVVIVSRNQHHASQALAALQAGKHVFIEKPMALTEDECRRLFSAQSESGQELVVGFNRRFAPVYLRLKEELAKRTGPAVLNCRINSPGISGSYWMADPSSGGAILGEACHFVDLMYWLLDSEPIAVSAFSLPTGKKVPIGENNVVACFRFADGSLGNLTYTTVGSNTSAGERVEVYAQGMAANAEDFKHTTVRKTIVRKHSSWFAQKGYADQMQSFLNDLRHGRQPSVGVRDGARATIGCLRMLESASTMTTLSIDLEAMLNIPS